MTKDSARLAADLIDDDDLVLGQLGVSSEHAQQHALCQKRDLCAAARRGVESDAICNVIPVLLEGLKCHPAPKQDTLVTLMAQTRQMPLHLLAFHSGRS